MSPRHAIARAPVLLFTYRKSHCLPALHDALRAYAPPRLYVAHNQFCTEAERQQVSRVRDTLLGWRFPFPVEYLFQERHLGINDSFHGALDHVFAREPRLIVLEDDTIPSPSFFAFCNAMLERFDGSPEVGSIIGCNLGLAGPPDSSFLARFAIFHWGWASWAGKWRLGRSTPLPWGSVGQGIVPRLDQGGEVLGRFLDRLGPGSMPWDVRRGSALALQGQLTVLPGTNLVANRGFVPEGTYTNFAGSRFAGLEAGALEVERVVVLPDGPQRTEYERRTADLILEILARRGELGLYGLADPGTS